MTKKILVIAAHADDEALGCGGTIARHVSQGDNVSVVFIADGVTSRINAGQQESEQRETAAKQALQVLGITQSYALGFPDNRLDAVPLLDIVQQLEKIIFKIQPDIIYTHHIGDLNIDHQITHQAVMTACRPQPDFCVKEIYSFEVLSSTEWQTPNYHPFLPNVFVDITEYIEAKRQALKAYSMEMRQPPHTRSIENSIKLAEVRGASVGLHYAEAFMLIRKLK